MAKYPVFGSLRLGWELEEFALPISLRKYRMGLYGRFWIDMEK
jgi:hypothetical protein